MHLRSYKRYGVVFGMALTCGLSFTPWFGARAVSQQPPPQSSKPQTPANPVKEEDPVPVGERPVEMPAPVMATVGPDQFGSFYGPQVNNRGDVAFLGRYMAPTAPAGFGQAIFIRSTDGEWRFVRDSDRAPGSTETLLSYGPYSISEQGDVILTASFSAKTPGPSERSSSGVFLRGSSGFTNVVKLGQDVPNMPSRYSSFSNPSVNTKGTIAFVAAYSDPDGRGLFVSEQGQVRIVARSGQRISANETLVFSEHYYPSSINERGEVAFLCRVGVGAGIFVTRSTGIELIAIDGRPSPVVGAKYLGFGNRTPSINDKGEVAFSAFYDGPNAGRALFFKGTGPTKLVLTSTDKTLKYKFTDVMNPELNNRGDIAFIGRLEGRAYGIFVKSAKGIEPIAMTGELATGMKAGEEFNNFAQQPSMNDRGDIVFYAQLKNGNVGIFIKDAKGLRPFVLRGDKLPFPSSAAK